jgi:hypothetical protein
MICAVQMDSCGIIYVSGFIKIGSGIQKLIGGTQTPRQQGDLISLLLFFKIKKVC